MCGPVATTLRNQEIAVMRKITVLIFGLALVLGGLFYAAAQASDHKDHGKASCCAKVKSDGAESCCVEGAECCKEDGSCCAEKGAAHCPMMTAAKASCCKEGAACCVEGAECCAKKAEAGSCCEKKVSDPVAATGCCAEGGACCAEGAGCCASKAAA